MRTRFHTLVLYCSKRVLVTFFQVAVRADAGGLQGIGSLRFEKTTWDEEFHLRKCLRSSRATVRGRPKLQAAPEDIIIVPSRGGVFNAGLGIVGLSILSGHQAAKPDEGDNQPAHDQ
jgi:hypothetical protein